jgi:tRNA (uracil-5-)-methyltransferase TRM9
MTKEIIDLLNELNKQFYNETGSLVWNQKPDYYWEGWYQLTQYIKEDISKLEKSNQTNYKILDLGCGNARFANFINAQLTPKQVQNIHYVGVDFSINFMEQSNSQSNHNFAKHELLQLDILKQLDQLQNQQFDLVVMFGLIHHIPSLQVRKDFIEQANKFLTTNSLLIFTTWQYLDTPRLIKRVVDSQSEAGKSVYQRLGIKKTDLEVGDNILDWVKKVYSYRYSHYFDEQEIRGYINDNDLELIDSFVCDGRDSKRNKYYICKLSGVQNTGSN